MSQEVTPVTSFHLAHTKEGKISVAHIEKPYGEFSSPVTSIGISLDGEKEEWKVHIPYENLDELIKALNQSREVCKSILHERPHSELGSDTGGGQ